MRDVCVRMSIISLQFMYWDEHVSFSVIPPFILIVSQPHLYILSPLTSHHPSSPKNPHSNHKVPLPSRPRSLNQKPKVEKLTIISRCPNNLHERHSVSASTTSLQHNPQAGTIF